MGLQLPLVLHCLGTVVVVGELLLQSQLDRWVEGILQQHETLSYQAACKVLLEAHNWCS